MSGSSEKRRLYKAVAAMLLSSTALFVGISALSEDIDGAVAGIAVSVITAVIIFQIVRFYLSRVLDSTHQLIVVAILITQVTPFLFGGIYGAFGYDGTCIDTARSAIDALYFSYTTFTTVGYGDLVPIGYCRIVSSAQGMIGYLLLGALGAALYASLLDRQNKRANRSDSDHP